MGKMTLDDIKRSAELVKEKLVIDTEMINGKKTEYVLSTYLVNKVQEFETKTGNRMIKDLSKNLNITNKKKLSDNELLQAVLKSIDFEQMQLVNAEIKKNTAKDFFYQFDTTPSEEEMKAWVFEQFAEKEIAEIQLNAFIISCFEEFEEQVQKFMKTPSN